MRFKGIIYDLDGTLANTLEDIATSMNRVLAIHGYPVKAVNDYKLLVGRGLDNLVRQSLPPGESEQEITDVCLKEFISDYGENCLVKTHLYDGIRQVLMQLESRGVKQAVFSNKAEVMTLKIVESLLPDVSFVKVSGARIDFPKKPDPTVAVQIKEMMGFQVNEIVYMGDSDVDMQTANAAGLFAAGVTWGFRSRDELIKNGASVILNHPLELLKIFNLL